MSEKKKPQRKCIGCGKEKEKKDLIRIVKSPDGIFSIDRTGKAQGRGAYICNDIDCLLLAKKNHGLERSFRQKLSDDIYEKLSEEISKQ